MKNEINKQLEDLYKSKYANLTVELKKYNDDINDLKNRATNSLMLRADNEWTEADIKIMVFGQENNIWGGKEFGNHGVFCGKITETIDIYENFYLNDQMYSCPFWNEYRNLKSGVNSQGKKISFLWNNIVKIGRIGIGCVPKIHKITMENFDVISEEIRILKPDILVFFTGPNYDK